MVNDRVDILWVDCDVTGVLTTVVDPVLADKLFDSVAGWCGPDDELIPLLGSDALVVVVVGGDGELRTPNNSAEIRILNLLWSSWV